MSSRRLMFGSVLGFTILAVSAAVGFAQCTTKPAQKTDKKPKPKVTCLTGTVKSLDVKKRDLVVTTGKGKQAKTVALKVCPKALIQIDGKKAKLAAVKAGTPVRLCTITNDKGVRIAVAVTIGKGKCPHMAACCPDDCPHKGNCKDDCHHPGKCHQKGHDQHPADACKDGCKDGCPHDDAK